MQLELGKVFEGKISKIMNYGAFVDFDGGASGMIHISEISKNYIKDINDHIKLGDIVKVKVIGIDDRNKVSLSLKDAQPDNQDSKLKSNNNKKYEQKSYVPRSFAKPDPPSTGDAFEDLMNKFKKRSDDIQSDLKRISDPRKGTNRRSY